MNYKQIYNKIGLSMAKKEHQEEEQDVSSESGEDVSDLNEDSADSDEVDNYEFSQEENMVFEELSLRVVFVARIMVIASILGAVRAILVIRTENLQEILSGIFSFLVVGIMLVVGFFHFRASKSFKNIINTEGDDIEHLMDAMSELKKYYQVFCWLAWGAIISVAAITLVKFLETL